MHHYRPDERTPYAGNGAPPSTLGGNGDIYVDQLAIGSALAVYVKQQGSWTAGAVGFGLSGQLTSADQATTTQTQAALAGLTFPIGANESWVASVRLTVTGVTGGGKFTVSGPVSPTSLRMTTFGATSGVTAYSTDSVTALDTVSGAYGTSSAVTLVFIDLVFNNGTTAGNVAFKFANVTSTNSFVCNNGFFTARRTA